MPNVERTPAPYLQIADSLRSQIKSGELREGERVPSTRKLAADWNVAPQTAAKALTTLRSEGLVQGEPGIGTIVCAASAIHAPGAERLRASRATGHIYPPGEHAVILSAELASATPEIADALGLERGAAVIRRERVTYRDDTPVSASVTWMDGALAGSAPLLLSAERIIAGTVGYVAQVTGRTAVGYREQHAAWEATEGDAQSLGIEPGTPVSRGRNWWWDSDGTVLEYGESVSIARRWKTYEGSVA